MAEGTASLRRRARFAVPALVYGRVGVVVAPGGRLLFVLQVGFRGGRISSYDSYDVIADPARPGAVGLAVLDVPEPPGLSLPRPTP